MLERLFSSKARIEILNAFFIFPGREFYLRELERLTGQDYKNISMELKNLERIGLLKSRKSGNLKYFRVNKEFVIHRELQSIFLKTKGAAGMLKKALERAGGIDYAFIYGSLASGMESGKSDVDLMVIGSISFEDLLKRLRRAERVLTREINPSLFSLSEFRKRLEKKDPFIQQVMTDPKLMLVGDEVGLRRITE